MLVMPKHVKMWQDSRRQQQQSRCCRAKEAATAGLVQGYSQAAECSPTLQQQQHHQRGAAAQISSAAHQATLLHFDLRSCPCVGKDNSSSSTLTFLPTPANSAAFPQIQSRKSYYAYLNLTMCPTTRGLHLSGLRSWPPQPAAPGRRTAAALRTGNNMNVTGNVWQTMNHQDFQALQHNGRAQAAVRACHGGGRLPVVSTLKP